MILRDPVHGLIAFEGRAEAVIQALLRTTEVQRLRRVRQLGLASLVFPGAEHSRFAHAIGAAHVMARLQDRIRQCQDVMPERERLDEEAAADGLAAALLHDLGHGPFSHLFEEILPHARTHESWTREVLIDPSTQVHAALEDISPGMAMRVADLLQGRYRLDYMSRAVSGTLDVDRADYLLRDSHMTGVRYGLYDLDWLLRGLCFAEIGGSWVIAVDGRKGLPPIESFFLGRHFMYQQVYHHKATRAAEAVIRAIFVRVRELVVDGSPPQPLPIPFRAAALGEELAVRDYLAMDDGELMTCVAGWADGCDDVLSDFARRLRDRDLPKTVALPEDEPSVWEDAKRRASDIAAAHGLRPDLTVRLDFSEDVPYPEPDDDGPDGLWVVQRSHSPKRLGQMSFPLGELRNKRICRPRLVFPADLREEILGALGGLLQS